MRFISFDIFATGVRALECAFNARTSSFVQGLTTRRAGLVDAVFFAVDFLVAAFLGPVDECAHPQSDGGDMHEAEVALRGFVVSGREAA